MSITRSSSSEAEFTRQSLNQRVTVIPGVSRLLAEQLNEKGTQTADQIFGFFLLIHGDEPMFDEWFFDQCGAIESQINQSRTSPQAMATIVIKSRLGGTLSFMEVEKSTGGDLEVEESSTVFYLPRLVSAADGSISNRVMTHLRLILGEEGIALDVDRTHIFRIGIDPMTAIAKLSELGFSATSLCSESSVDGGSIMAWTMTHNNKTRPPQVDIRRSRATESTPVINTDNGETAEEEEEPAVQMEKADSEYVPSEPDDDDDYKATAVAGQKRGRGRPKKVAPVVLNRQTVSIQNGGAGRRILQQLAGTAVPKPTPPKTPARSAKIVKASASNSKKRGTSQDEESFGSQEVEVEGVEETRPIINELSQREVTEQRGYVTTTNDRLGTEEAERLLMGKTRIDPVTEMPRKAPGGSVWLYTDQGEPWRSRDYMSDGYRMQQCSTRMWPAQQPVLCVIQYRAIVNDRQSNDFCRYVMMLPSALHATAAECQNMRHGRRPSERTPFFYLIHYVGDHTICTEADLNTSNRRGPHRTLPSQVFFEHMQRGEKAARLQRAKLEAASGGAHGLASPQESDITNGQQSANDDDIQEITASSPANED